MKFRSEVFIGLTALIVSVCALFVSIRQSKMMKIQQEAMLYPHLIFESGYSGEGFRLTVRNSGTGIAMVKSVEVSCRDHFFTGWEEIFDYFLPEGHQVGWNVVGASTITESVLIPGEMVTVFRTPWNPETRVLVDSLGELNFKIQYGSLLEDHWEITSQDRLPKKINYKPNAASIQFDKK